jgi:hypothetical protein
MRNRAGVVLVAVAAVLAVAVPAAEAKPTIGDGSCDSGDYCYYQDTNYGGSVLDDYSNTAVMDDYWYFNTNFSPNDRTSSMWNRSSSQAMFLWQNTNYGGNKACKSAGNFASSLPTTGWSLGDNSASSMLVASAC